MPIFVVHGGKMPDQEYYRLLDGPHGRQPSNAGGPNKPGYWDEQQAEATGVDPSPIVPAHYFGGEYAGGSEVGPLNPGVPSVDPVLVVKEEDQKVKTDAELEAESSSKDSEENGLSLDELQVKARAKGLPVSGTKAELRQRIADAE
jgi:SAP domain